MRRTLYALVGYDLINELDNVVYQGHVYMLAIDAAGNLAPTSDTPRKRVLLDGLR